MKRLISTVLLLSCTFLFKNTKGQKLAPFKSSSDFSYGYLSGKIDRLQYIGLGSDKLSEAIFQTKDSVVRTAYIINMLSEIRENVRLSLDFWKNNPDDPRRFIMLTSPMLTTQSIFWKNTEDGIRKFGIKHACYPPTLYPYNIPLDTIALRDWEPIYQLVKEDYVKYLSDSIVRVKGKTNEEVLHNFYTTTLRQFIRFNYNEAYRKNGKIDLVLLKKMIQDASKNVKYNDFKYFVSASDPWSGKNFTDAINYDLSFYQHLGLTNKEMSDFVISFKDDKNPLLQKWAEEKSGLFSLMDKERLKIKYQAIDGRVVDLDQLRGKVVLLDCWSMNCSSCIDRLPTIKKVYDKYKNQGFVVISVNFDAMADKKFFEAVKDVEHKVGADWPTLMIGVTKGSNNKVFKTSLRYELHKKYTLSGVPQLLLLDKSGKLILHNHNLSSGQFPEELLKKLLKEPYTPGKEGKSK